MPSLDQIDVGVVIAGLIVVVVIILIDLFDESRP